MHRLGYSLLMMLLPRFLPKVIKYLGLIWKLTFDKRVNIFLRTLVPLALVYAIIPTDLVKDGLPFGIGRFDDFIVLGMAALLLIKLAPQHVVNGHLGIEPISLRPEDDDPSSVVDGSSRPID